MSNKKVVNIDEHNLKKLMVYPLAVIQTSIEEIIKRLSKENLCKWLCSLSRSISPEAFDELVEEAESWEIIREEYFDSASGIDNLELGKPKLILLKGGKR